jgi:DNA-binding GntR family transcriptional regulator
MNLPVKPNDTEKQAVLNYKSLRELVYGYLRDEISNGNLKPGSPIQVDKLCQHLEISRTPVRDALIMLECEGFINNPPRRAFSVRGLTIDDVESIYEIIGSLEATALGSIFENIGPAEISEMERINADLLDAIERGDFEYYHKTNRLFHLIFLHLSRNRELIRQVNLYHQRLHDFLRRRYVSDWELEACEEHRQLLDMIKRGDKEAAMSLVKDVHWSFKVQESNIRNYYYILGETK